MCRSLALFLFAACIGSANCSDRVFLRGEELKRHKVPGVCLEPIAIAIDIQIMKFDRFVPNHYVAVQEVTSNAWFCWDKVVDEDQKLANQSVIGHRRGATHVNLDGAKVSKSSRKRSEPANPKVHETKGIRPNLADELESAVSAIVKGSICFRRPFEEIADDSQVLEQLLGVLGTRQSPQHVRPIAWVTKDQHVLCVVEELPLGKCTGFPDSGPIDPSMIDVAVCICDVTSEALWAVLPLVIFECNQSMSTESEMTRCIQRSKMYGSLVLAHRSNLPVFCCDVGAVVKLVVEPGFFNGRHVTLGRCNVQPSRSEPNNISELIGSTLEEALLMSSLSLPDAAKCGRWGGFLPSGEAQIVERSVHGTLWKAPVYPGSLIKLVSRAQDCRHDTLCNGLRTAFLEARRAVFEAGRAVSEAGRAWETARRAAAKARLLALRAWPGARIAARFGAWWRRRIAPATPQVVAPPAPARLSDAEAWLERIRRGRCSLPPRTNVAALDAALRRVRRFAAVFDVYRLVVSDEECAIVVVMHDCGHALSSVDGFALWAGVSRAEKAEQLRAVAENLLLLYTVGFIHWDCRVENVVVGAGGKLAAIDLDWLELSQQLQDQHTRQNRWYPTCGQGVCGGASAGDEMSVDDDSEAEERLVPLQHTNFELQHLAWQLYLVSFLLFTSTSADMLSNMSSGIYLGHLGSEGTFEWFVGCLSARCGSNALDAALLADMIVSIADSRSLMPLPASDSSP